MNEIRQHEDPEAAMHIALWKARTPQANEPGAMVSGAQFVNFKQGWAHKITTERGAVSHWFTRDGDHTQTASALCAGVESPLRWLHGPGSYPRCRLCTRKMTLLIRRGAM